jgi:DNA-binding MarR family transcriptional regulator
LSAQELHTQPSVEGVPAPIAAWTRLLRAHASTTRLLSAELHTRHGLTLNDYEALGVLARAEGRRLRRVDLARRLLLTPSGVTRLLEGLEAAGLVARASCRDDLRVAYAELTDAGAEKHAAASCAHVRAIEALLGERFSEEETELLAELLGRFPGVLEGGDACPAGA